MSSKKLPQPNKIIHLKDDGYSTHKSKNIRHKALSRSSQKHGSLKIMRRLNLIRNLSKNNSKQKLIMTDDVEYLKKLYQREKKKSVKSGSHKKTHTKKKVISK